MQSVGDRILRTWSPTFSYHPLTRSHEVADEASSLSRADPISDLDPERLERMLEYYDDFYEVINSERKFRRALSDCRRMPT